MTRAALVVMVALTAVLILPGWARAATYEPGLMRNLPPANYGCAWTSNPYPVIVDGEETRLYVYREKYGCADTVVYWELPSPVTVTGFLFQGGYNTRGGGNYWILTVIKSDGTWVHLATTKPGDGGLQTLEQPVPQVVAVRIGGVITRGFSLYFSDVDLYGYVPDTVPPAQPSGMQVFPDMGELRLSWDPNAEPDLAGYRVRWAQEGAPFSIADVGKATSYTISNLTNGTEYVVQVIAYDIDGNESPPAEATGVPQLPPPTNLAATSPGDGTVQLHWEPSLSEGDTYRIYRDGQHLSDTEETSYHDAAVAVGETYSYVVVTVDANGAESSPAGPVQVTVTDTTPPPTPQNLQVQLTGNTATISWIPVVASDLAGYQVYRNSQLLARTTETTYEDRGLAGGSEYTYQVTAYDQYGNEGVPAKATLGTPGTPLSKAGYSLSDFARYLADSLALYGPAWLVAAGLVLAGALLDRALLYWRRGHL